MENINRSKDVEIKDTEILEIQRLWDVNIYFRDSIISYTIKMTDI